ncbi:MAG: c-type cytochrome [Gemmataceae bacterium]
MGGEAVPLLLAGWKGHAPALRSQILEVLLQRAGWTPAVLAAIETKAVLPLEIDSARRQQLLSHRDRAVRARAEKAFAGAVAPDRQKVIDGYHPATRAVGDVVRGQAVFVKVCATCHKLGDLGQEVGPDLAGLADKSAEYMLIAILDPNRAVEARYLSYQAETVDGRVFTGILTAETGSGITLVGTDGKPVTILRRNLERLAGSGKSLMPEGIEKDVSPEAMADLLAFLRSKQRTTPPKTLAGNRPEPVRPDRDGVLHLTARNAEVHGPSLIFEAKYGNLGFWSAPADRAVWTVEVPRGGKFQVWLDHACDPANAGNTFVLEADAVLLRGKVESTGTWDDYRQKSVGTLTLPAGSHRLTMRPDGALRGAMIDLRSLRLVPVKP